MTAAGLARHVKRVAQKKSRSKAKGKASRSRQDLLPVKAALFARKWIWRALWAPVILVLFLVILFRFVNPPTTHTIWTESRRLDGVERVWVPLEEMSVHMPRSVVAAEDANFCLHWGFDMAAIREALDDGGQRGASTLTQQTVKNVFLWQNRSWLRKALEATITPLVELAWPKRRILEVYLNVAEMGEGVFGAEAAAQSYFGIPARDLDATRAARIAAVLPNPKQRDAAKPTPWLKKRAASIADGAATIAVDGRAACFED
ncbi:monofunctional biosynthetic peptidoglycan transglycosylase [Aliiruegeria lutimaris]|uniref:Biosynthetic peptidoglycan transglycosylase n=1 Tax=Aliiruegeria lutimaris TaxID=571298 RepID=A0A1G8R8F4_9RHOB|nr:monofunctional biosynthetic peptidoglycan transglycosylase [Aliiruegeria lutimaris]